jgi:(p)ppGpp synthase/HD superfamily hydrolase
MTLGIVDTAMRLALQAHHGVVNKHDGEPYILHVHRVASNFGDDTLDQQLRKAVAWLHDTVEDTDLTLKKISETFYDYSRLEIVSGIYEGVDAMTKRSGESNEDYYWRVKQNPIATDVKIADIHDNFGRNHLIEDEDTRLRMAKKYSLGIEILCRQT